MYEYVKFICSGNVCLVTEFLAMKGQILFIIIVIES